LNAVGSFEFHFSNEIFKIRIVWAVGDHSRSSIFEHLIHFCKNGVVTAYMVGIFILAC
jgi:hypothetical protein